MTGTSSKGAIVKGDEETRGWESIDKDKDARLAKRAKVKGKGVETQEEEEERAKVEGKGDGTQKEEEEEEEKVKDKVERLRRLLKGKPSRLENKEMEEVIRYLDVRDIISCASKLKEAEGKRNEEFLYLDLGSGSFVPSPEKVDRLMKLMLLCGVEKLKVVDMYILYSNFPKARFVAMLLNTLDSYSKRRPDDGRSFYPKEMRADIIQACRVLPWKLFAHVMYVLTLLPVFKCTVHSTTGTSEEEEDDDGEIQRKAAEDCDICDGKGKHSGVYGYYCSYWQPVPYGNTVGPWHMLICCKCCSVGRRANTCVRCRCGSKESKAVPCDAISWNDII